jgi:hypothetical protein
MPRYYFNVHHEQSSADKVGEELPDKHAAWKEATRMAGDILRDLDGRFKPGQDWKLEVTNERGLPVYAILVHAEQNNDCASTQPASQREHGKGEHRHR